MEGKEAERMKYANGMLMIGNKQMHAFVCAKTYKRMIELLKASPNYFNNYWSKCGNDSMKSVAQDKEGIWISKDFLDKGWEKLKT